MRYHKIKRITTYIGQRLVYLLYTFVNIAYCIFARQRLFDFLEGGKRRAKHGKRCGTDVAIEDHGRMCQIRRDVRTRANNLRY